eukprot:1084871-Pleurochrysis_carterae.AAC.4
MASTQRWRGRLGARDEVKVHVKLAAVARGGRSLLQYTEAAQSCFGSLPLGAQLKAIDKSSASCSPAGMKI